MNSLFCNKKQFPGKRPSQTNAQSQHESWVYR